MVRIRGTYGVLNLSIYVIIQWICCYAIGIIITTVIAGEYQPQVLRVLVHPLSLSVHFLKCKM